MLDQLLNRNRHCFFDARDTRSSILGSGRETQPRDRNSNPSAMPRSKIMQEPPVVSTDAQVRTQPQVRSTAYLLIAVGILELVYGQWAAPPGQITLDIMWLAVGLALYFGNARVIAVIRWIALFAVVPAVVMPVQQILLAPLGLTMVQLRLYPTQVLMFFVPLILTAAVVSFVAWRLNSESVKSALRAHGRTPGGYVFPVVLGLLAIVGSVGYMLHMLDGPDAARAEQMVAKQFGTKYKYFTNRLDVVSNDGTTVYATVQMWNDQEVVQVPVHWRR